MFELDCPLARKVESVGKRPLYIGPKIIIDVGSTNLLT
jgi:hypothetical protein